MVILDVIIIIVSGRAGNYSLLKVWINKLKSILSILILWKS